MLDVGQKAPDFALPGVDGQTHSLADLLSANQAVAVIFSCNHCPYVRAWEGRMKAIQADYSDKGVVLAAINVNDAERYPEDDFDHMKAHAEEEGFNFLYLYDESQEVAHGFGGTHTPHVFLLDAEGVVQYQGAIDDNHDDPEAVQQHYLRDALDAVLEGKTPAITHSDPRGCTIKWKN